MAAAERLEPQRFEPESVVRRVDRVAVLALAHAGTRLVAAGERGRILLSDDEGMSWKAASTPTHHTLTSLAFTDARTGYATGHQRVLLRTEDGGDTWKHAALESKERPALFAVRVEGDRGIAVGAYGAYFETTDAGRTWTTRRIGPPDFDRHLTGIAAAGGGRFVLAGEAGALLASADGGATWRVLDSPYEGSFFGALGLGEGIVIAYGMRGNAFRSADAGKTWQRIDLGNYKGALQGASQLPDGTVILTGADGMVADSKDRGATFTRAPLASRALVSAVAQTARGRRLVAGPSGLRWHDAP
jgi:photosystem II stability/assembly factor-like uncharacterized protein